MNGIETIRTALNSSRTILEWYLSDLADGDLLVRPVPDANHLAWQLGHLISSERFHISQQLPDVTLPELTAGFAQAHQSATARSDRAADFSTKAEYVRLFGEMRAATITCLDRLRDEDLDRPAQGQVAAFAPTLGAVFLLVSNHTLMHGGQATVVRRKLGKPVLF